MSEIKWITKTDAKNNYFLKDDELINLEVKTAGCSWNKRKTSTLYKQNDIESYFMIKHNIERDEIENKLEELQEKKNEKKLKTARAKKEKEQQRREKLENELLKIGVEMRDDSNLCKGYINKLYKAGH